MYTDESVALFKHRVWKSIPPLNIGSGHELEVLIEYHGQFYNKGNNEIKRKDGQNLDKCLYDVLFEKWGLDDSIVFKGTWEKVHNPNEEFTLIEIRKIGRRENENLN